MADTKESLLAEAKQHHIAVVGEDSVRHDYAAAQALKNHDYKTASIEAAQTIGSALLHELKNPIGTTAEAIEQRCDEIRASFTPSGKNQSERSR